MSNKTAINPVAIEAQSQSLEKTEKGLAVIVDGDTCNPAVPANGYAYIKNNTHGLAEGLYYNNSGSAFPTSGGTANDTVFQEVSEGGLNRINDNLAKKLTCYSGYSSVGLTNTATINQLYSAMPANSKLLISANGSDKCAIDLGLTNGCTIEITKLTAHRGWAIATSYAEFGFKIGAILAANNMYWKTLNVS